MSVEDYTRLYFLQSNALPISNYARFSDQSFVQGKVTKYWKFWQRMNTYFYEDITFSLFEGIARPLLYSAM